MNCSFSLAVLCWRLFCDLQKKNSVIFSRKWCTNESHADFFPCQFYIYVDADDIFFAPIQAKEDGHRKGEARGNIPCSRFFTVAVANAAAAAPLLLFHLFVSYDLCMIWRTYE